MGKLHKSMDSIRNKCVRLGLEVEGGAAKKIMAPSSSGLKLPVELPSVEDVCGKTASTVRCRRDRRNPALYSTLVLRKLLVFSLVSLIVCLAANLLSISSRKESITT